jgi:hypothetical protein
MHDESIAPAVRSLRAEGLTYRQIRERLGVTQRAVQAVLAPDTIKRSPEQQARRTAKARVQTLARRRARQPIPGVLLLANGDRALVDMDDWERFQHLAFSYSGLGYVATNTGGQRCYLHRLILGLEPGNPLVCDHINRNKLDNRRANLRVVTQKENCANRGGIFDKAAA